MYNENELAIIEHLKTAEPMTAYEMLRHLDGALTRYQVSKMINTLVDNDVLEVATNCNHVYRYRLKYLHKQRTDKVIEHLDLNEPHDFDYIADHSGLDRKMVMRILGELKRRNRVICQHKLQGKRYFILNIVRPYGCESELTERFNKLLYGYRKENGLLPQAIDFEADKLNAMEPEPEQ